MYFYYLNVSKLLRNFVKLSLTLIGIGKELKHKKIAAENVFI